MSLARKTNRGLLRVRFRATKIFTFACMLVLVLSSSGCILAPFIQSYQDLGIHRGDRERKLNESVRELQNALYWKKGNIAMAFAEKSAQPDLRKRVMRVGNTERLVDHEVLLMQLDDSGMEAEVDLKIRYYRIPSYVVEERFERQTWQFSAVNGWKVSALENIDMSDIDDGLDS